MERSDAISLSPLPFRDMIGTHIDLQAAATRFAEFRQNGKIHMVERVFHGMPTKNATISLNTSTPNPERKPVTHLGSYNYSGLNGHPYILQKAIDAITQYGTTSSGVRLLNGTCDLHHQLEKRLANFLGVEEVVTFSSCFAANLAVLGTLCREGDIVLSDTLNHQSIIDGLRLSDAKVVPYRHASPRSIEACLKRLPYDQRKFIVTDGVFSMDGDLAPLPEIAALAEQYNAFVIVDDAHGTGHVGPNGRGLCAHYGVTDRIDLITGSLSKGLPGIGGFVATRHDIAGVLRAASNPYIFSASLPPSVLASIMAALDILEETPERITTLTDNAHYFAEQLRNAGFEILNTKTGIIPILTFDEDKAYALARALHEDGIYVNPVAYPAVSKSRSRIRINLSASLTREELEHGLAAIIKAGKQLDLI